MDQQAKLTAFLGAARLQPYLDASHGNIQRASDLYQWNMKLGGSLHTQISYVEIATRNAIDVALANWNSNQPRPNGSNNFGREWTDKDGLGGHSRRPNSQQSLLQSSKSSACSPFDEILIIPVRRHAPESLRTPRGRFSLTRMPHSPAIPLAYDGSC